MSELESIFAEAKTVKVGKVEVEIKQVSLGDIPLLVELYSSAQVEGKTLQESLIAFAKNPEGLQKLQKAIFALTNIEADKVQKLNMGGLIGIVAAVIKENVDFLQTHVMPQVQAVAATVKKADGSNQSKS